MAANKCQHPTCSCDVSPGEKFCSDACRDLADTSSAAETRCGCDHDTCVHEAKT
jgi:hypothetical protein